MCNCYEGYRTAVTVGLDMTFTIIIMGYLAFFSCRLYVYTFLLYTVGVVQSV